ncbi:hypothetical protein F5Y17DRAFT_461365 [Xylariaceae sp. FL0594]|nr:hypothetical protein F5Y17DRAFT_461365 [Xylariaceae sp. FL0594]
MAGMPMGNISMAGGPGGGPVMMSNLGGPNPGQAQRPPENNRATLNTYIYDYFLREGMYDCARAMLNSEQALNVHKSSPRHNENGSSIGNGPGDDAMDTDSKDDLEPKRPSDLPAPNVPNSSDSCFLLEWFCVFWDILSAQRNKGGVSTQVTQYVNHTQHQARLRQHNQHEMLRMRPDMYGNPMMQRMQNGMHMGVKQHPTLARTAMANNQNNPQMLLQQAQAAKQNQMQRDGSMMDGIQNRPLSPGGAENAPSPNKRARLEGAGPFNPQHGNMNGQRPQQGMPVQQGFPTQPNRAQAKQVANYQQELQQQQLQQMPNKQVPNPNGLQGQGSPMMAQGPDSATMGAFYTDMNAPGGMRPGGPGPTPGGGSNHALQDYQMQLMLLEQQNKKRLMMARQEQDSIGITRDGSGAGPGGPPGPNGQPFQDTSPQGARPGASPNPSEQMKRGTPQMNPAGIPSPLPEGAQSRGSPNAMSFMPNSMDPNMQSVYFQKGMNGMDGNMVAGQMNGNMRPPSSHPGQNFNGQMAPQMMARQQGMPQGGPQQMPWQGPNGNGMGPQGPQGPVQGGPQRGMPPPSAPGPAAGVNGRTNTSSPQTTAAAPPTPQQGTKAAPKKKDTKGGKKVQKKPSQPAGATPAAEANQEPELSGPATPMTPAQAGNLKAGQAGGAVHAGTNASAPAPQLASAPLQPQPEPPTFGEDIGSNDIFALGEFPNPRYSESVLPEFDFDSFLHDGDPDIGAFDFSGPNMGMDAPGEIGAE